MNETLEQKTDQIAKVFNTADVLNIKVDHFYIQKYYKVNQIPYSVLHTKTDMIYMGISRNGKYKDSDLKEHALFVEKYINAIKAKKILELATGRGANSAFLANRNKKALFYGIDISEGQLKFAYQKANALNNYYPSKNDYHNLRLIKDNYFDICFVVEALCYSTQKDIVLSEVYRILKGRGYFIIFDGYKSDKHLSQNEQLACTLTEKGMALDKFEKYSDFSGKIAKSDFKLEYEEDLSQYVLPTMRRFERIAKPIFKHPRFGKTLFKMLPKEFVYNAISGYLMPSLIENEIAKYYVTVLKK